MKERDVTIVNIQLALFFDPVFARPDLAMDVIRKDTGVFDGAPVVMPVPEGSAFDSAHSVLLSSTDRCSLSISRQRLDFYFGGKGLETLEDNVGKFLEISEKIISTFQQQKYANITRIGYIVRYFVKDSGKGSVLAPLVNPPMLETRGKPLEVFLRVVNRISMGDVELNNNVSLEGATVGVREGEDAGNHEGFMIVRDYNTIPEQKINLSKILFRKLVDTANKNQDIKELLKLIYA